MRKTLENNTKKYRTIEDDFYFLGICLFIIFLIIYLAVYRWDFFFKNIKMPPCFFHLLTGYYCPGCGGTRAVKALFQGKILRSMYYHPVVGYGAIVYVCFMGTQTIERMSRHKLKIGMLYHNGYLWAAVAVVLANFCVKNILHYLFGYIM